MINCNECTYFHDQATRLFCAAGVMDVTIIGGAVVVAKMTQCDRFDGFAPVEAILVMDKIDKRTKEWKQVNG